MRECNSQRWLACLWKLRSRYEKGRLVLRGLLAVRDFSHWVDWVLPDRRFTGMGSVSQSRVRALRASGDATLEQIYGY